MENAKTLRAITHKTNNKLMSFFDRVGNGASTAACAGKSRYAVDLINAPTNLPIEEVIEQAVQYYESFGYSVDKHPECSSVVIKW